MQTPARSIEAVLIKYVRECLDRSSLSFDSFAAAVVEHYLAAVPAPQRSFEVAAGGDAFADTRANSKKLGRYFSPAHDLKLPAVLVPSLIEALCEPYRGACCTAVVELIMPERVAAGQLQSEMVAAKGMAKEAGEALAAFVGLLDGGLGNDPLASLEDCKLELAQALSATRQALLLVTHELEARTGRGAVVVSLERGGAHGS